MSTNGTVKKESTYGYNAMNWLQTLAKVDYNGGSKKTTNYTYNYDKNGNQTGVLIDGVATVTYQYDNLNRLTKTTKDGKDYTYSFNADGLRVKKADVAGTTVYLYESNKVVMELDAAGNMLANNVYGTNLLTRTVEGTTLYYMYNGHADVTALLDTKGNVVGSYYYDAWGNILESSGSMKDKNSILYAGYQYDSETELYYLNARMYDPKVARFLQEDTYRGEAADVLSLNLYTYCVNNPLIYYDPTGHEPWMLRTLVEKANGSVTFNSEDKSVTVTANGITKNYTTDDLMLFNGRFIIDDRLFKLDFGYKLSFWDNLNIKKPSLNIKSKENDIKKLNDVDFSVNSLKHTELYNMLPRVFQNNTENFVERYGAVGFMFSMFKVDSLYNLFEAGETLSDRQSYEHGLDPDGACAMSLEYKLNKNGTSGVEVDFMLQQARMEQLKQVMYYKGLQAATNAWELPKVAEPKFKKFNYSKGTSSTTLKGGGERAAQYLNGWGNGSMKEVVNEIAPGSKPIVTDSGKIIYNNAQTGKQVVYDIEGNYFRIEDTTMTGKKVYTDVNGNVIPNNKVVNGKQMGISQGEYNQSTHFNNTDAAFPYDMK